MIKPTIGRVVLYYEYGKTQYDAGEQPFSASVAYVHGERCINIGYWDHNGCAKNATSVALVQPGDEMPETGFCCWMPYQIGQAVKTEELQQKLAGK